ncbi:hypothetical protein AVEN_133234-1 [Araneus ventricosus]|uniref:Uncharacterized protein n=1 Tax=Araneus ventricosus TaxID=182803 RepID=A0A4Y2J6L9_ARAVE|nr:hypothetical protein AVEN_133234-1 [Araneus ventricosus]
MSPRTGPIRKNQNSQSLAGALRVSIRSKLTLTNVGEVQISTLLRQLKSPVLCHDPGLLISKMAFLSTTCKNSHHYFSLVSSLPTVVNVAPRPSNPRFVTLNCPVPFTWVTLSINAFLRVYPCGPVWSPASIVASVDALAPLPLHALLYSTCTGKHCHSSGG